MRLLGNLLGPQIDYDLCLRQPEGDQIIACIQTRAPAWIDTRASSIYASWRLSKKAFPQISVTTIFTYRFRHIPKFSETPTVK